MLDIVYGLAQLSISLFTWPSSFIYSIHTFRIDSHVPHVSGLFIARTCLFVDFHLPLVNMRKTRTT